MYIYQDGRLYIQKGEDLVGVEIYSDKVRQLGEERTKRKPSGMYLTRDEVFAKFAITEENPYIFPAEKKEVKIVEPVVNIKKPIGRPRSK